MKITNQIIEQVNAIVNKYGWEYEKCAIRVQYVPFELGTITHVSHVWIDGEETGDELPGLCCTAVEYIASNDYGEYLGDHLAVIGGNSYEYGEDSGEIIISDPVVIAIIA